MVALVREVYPGGNARILEIGCNVGRNLNALFSAGYRELAGVEINAEAVQLLRATFPDMARSATIHNSSIEQIIRSLPNDAYDIVLTMAVLEHLPRTSDWVFAEMARICRRYIITVEDEVGKSWRHFPRKYDEVFGLLGLIEVKRIDCSEVSGLGPGFFARAFRVPSWVDIANPKPT